MASRSARGRGRVFGGAPSWTLANALGSNGLWLVGDEGITLATQPVIADADMELATVTPPWEIGRANGTKEAGSPGGSGTRVLRLTSTSNTPYTRQNNIILGCRYYMSANARGDGTIPPRLNAGGAGIAWLGTSSTDWQNASGDVTASETYLILYGVGGGVGNWVELDNITAQNISVTAHTPKAATGALAGSTFVQATPAAMKWRSTTQLNGHYVAQYDGVADYDASDADAADWPLHKAEGFAFTTCYKPAAAAAGTDTLIDDCNATVGNVGITIEYDATNTQLTVKVANGGAGFEQNTSTGAATVAKGAWHYVSISWSEAGGVRILVDAAAAVTAASGGAASAADATATLQIGRLSGGTNFLAGELANTLIRVGAVDDATLARMHAEQKAYGGL